MVALLLAGFLLCLAVRNVEMHAYHLGACPTIEPQSDFKINRMLGIWYVIQKTSTASSCVVYNITKTDEPDEYKVEEISQHFLLALTPLKHGYHYTGTLKVPDSAVPARMTVSFPLSVAGKSSFTVFTTDYDTYAGIFTCQKLTFAHRQSATILSRTRTLDKMYLDKIRTRLANSQIDPFDLSLINQKDCPRNFTAGYNININDDTISAKAAAGVVRKAGEKLGDGIEYISGKTSEVYHKVADKAGDTSSRARDEFSRNMGDGMEYISGKTSQVYHKVADKAGDTSSRAREEFTRNMGDGMEYISGKTSEVYHKVADKAEDTSNKVMEEYRRNMDKDSEWLP